MMVCFYDHKKNLLLLPINRCGAGMFSEIASASTDLTVTTVEEFFGGASPDQIPEIVAIVRHPTRAFVSGVSEIFDVDGVRPEINDIDHRAYHLGSRHLSHRLAIPMIFASAGCTLTMWLLDELSEKMIELYPEHSEIINQHHSDDACSMRTSNVQQVLCWLKYEEYINSVNVQHASELTWEQWMEPELDLYKHCVGFRRCQQHSNDHNPKSFGEGCVRRLFDTEAYWCDRALSYLGHKLPLSLIAKLSSLYPRCFDPKIVELNNSTISRLGIDNKINI